MSRLWPNIEGDYKKPDGYPQGTFVSGNRESRSWNNYKKTKAIFTASPIKQRNIDAAASKVKSFYRIEINGFIVGSCSHIDVGNNSLVITDSIMTDHYNQLHKLNEGCCLAVVDVLPDGNAIRIYDFRDARRERVTHNSIEISFSKKIVRYP